VQKKILTVFFKESGRGNLNRFYILGLLQVPLGKFQDIPGIFQESKHENKTFF